MCFIWIEQQSFTCSADIKANHQQHPQMEDSGIVFFLKKTPLKGHAIIQNTEAVKPKSTVL